MACLAHFTNFKKSNTSNNKIPEYAKDFKNEWLYIIGINKKCWEFMKILEVNTDSFEEVFWSSRARALIRDFKNVLEAQEMGKLQNISKLKFKLSAVSKIIDLRDGLYFHIGHTFYGDFFSDDEFQDFFENLIIFTNNVNIKNEEDFEDDLYIDYFNGRYIRIDSFSELDNISDFDSISESESENESENENENENESESESESESD